MIRRTRVREKIKNVLRGLLEKKEDRLFLTSALVGDGQGKVQVSGDPKRIYVRASGEVLVVFNNRIHADEDTPIWIGYERSNPQLLQVLSLNYGSLTPGDSWIPPEIGEHGWTHRLYAEHGGNDIVWIEQRQFLPLSMGVSGDFEITIYPGTILTDDGWKLIYSQTVDLTPYIPDSGGTSRFAMIYLDQDGNVLVEAGVLTASLTIDDIPIPDEGCYGLCAIKLSKWQTAITDNSEETDIVDLRFPQSLPGAHSHDALQVELDFDDLGDVEVPTPADLDIARYEAATGKWKNTPLADAAAEDPDSQTHIHATLETYGDGVQRVFILPNNYEPLTTEVFINGLRQRFEIEWDELSEDSIKMGEAPHLDDLVTINYVPEVEAVVI